MTKYEPTQKVSCFLDKDTEIEGDIRFKETFRIDGKFKGKILSGNGLIIGATGEVEADVEVNTISINGRIKGEMRAKEKIEIFSQGRVTGTLVTPKLIIEEGALFQGTCHMELKVLESKNKEYGGKNMP